jgi:tetratricopeptide (TPR) repeat protein
MGPPNEALLRVSKSRRKSVATAARPESNTKKPARAPSFPVRWALAALFSATILAYSSAIKAPFIWDDIQGISDNPTIRTLIPLSVPLHPPKATALSGRPVVNLTLAVNYAINERLGVDQRPDPDGPGKSVGFHAFNILVHLACGTLLFGIIRRTLRQKAMAEDWSGAADLIALATCAIWMLHPLQTEALDYIVQRTELLAAACYLGTLYASIRAWGAGAVWARYCWYAAGVLICFLGMESKEVMISAPLAVLLYDRAFVLPSWRAVLRPRDKRGTFYLLLAATAAVVLASVLAGDRATSIGFSTTWYQYLYTQAWAIGHYLRLMIWPAGMILDYGQRTVADWRGVPGGLVLTAIGVATLLAWTHRPKWLGFGFLGACFFMILAPSSSVVPIVTEMAAERRFYLPGAAVILAVVTGLELVRRRRAPSFAPEHAMGAAMMLAAILGVVTFQRGEAYNDPESLWRESAAAVPDNARAYDNLAFLLLTRHNDRRTEADTLLRRAMAVDTTYLPAWINLAAIRAAEEKDGEAISLLTYVLRRQPDNFLANQHMGIVLIHAGRPAEAAPYFARAVVIDQNEEGLVLLGSTYLEMGRPDSAIAPLKAAVAYNSNRPSTLGLLGSAYTESGHASEAEPVLQRLVELAPNSAVVLAAYALNQAQLGKMNSANAALKAAMMLSAGDPEATAYMERARTLLRNK